MPFIKIMKLVNSIDKIWTFTLLMCLFVYILNFDASRCFAMSKSVAAHHTEGHVKGLQSTKAGYKYNYMVLL